MAARKQNMWPFSSSTKVKRKTRRPSRSMMSVGQSTQAAFKAGQHSGDVGEFERWLEYKGLSEHSGTLRARLQREYERGVDHADLVRGLAEEKRAKKAAVVEKKRELAEEKRLIAQERAEEKRQSAALKRIVTYKGYAIRPTEDGSFVIPKLDADSHFDSLKDAKDFLNDWKRNMGKKNPAKCAKARNGKRKRNPAGESVDAYKEFHGREPDELVTVTKEVHYHRHLAGAGKLEKIVVRSARQGARVTLSGFKGALLAFNEKRTQLFVEGGDQKVDLKQFGISAHPHEQEVLGEVLAVEYFTRKDHLRPEDGGEAIYVHKFSKPLPTLIYDVLNEQLTFSGGSYVILPEGIDR